MARVMTLVAVAAIGCLAQDQQFKEAGACGRCHVISVVEWGMSRHRTSGTACTACHGESAGHVADERNNIKPERVPRGEAIAGLCAQCHAKGCPKVKKTTSCDTCHHVHALVDPRKPVAVKEAAAAPARTTAGKPRTMPHGATIAVAGIEMVWVEGGEFEMGSEKWENAKPVHTVRVRPFYLGKSEVTPAQWRAMMGPSPGAQQVSWLDCQEFVRRLNARAPGAGLRLPTEAEWEFAARRADRLGLAGMLGGVWEWTSSEYRPYPYEDASGAGLKVLRGGGYADTPDFLDPAFRHGERPGRRLKWNGLRLAK